MYAPGREYGTRHYVYRRTNLPCLVCGTLIRQKRQVTRQQDETEDGEEKERIIYFCPCCQNTTVELPKIKKKRATLEQIESDQIEPDQNESAL